MQDLIPANRHERRAVAAIEAHHRNDDDLLTTEEMARVRGVPASRLNKERLLGDSQPFIKDGHLVRYRWGDYREWLASRPRATSTSELAAA